MLDSPLKPCYPINVRWYAYDRLRRLLLNSFAKQYLDQVKPVMTGHSLFQSKPIFPIFEIFDCLIVSLAKLKICLCTWFLF